MARHVGFGVETTYGTAVAATDFAEAIRETFQQNRNFEELKPIRTYSSRQINELTSSVAGDVELLGNFQDVGVPLKYLFGSVDTTGTTTPYTHTFPASTGIAARSGKSLTVEVQRDSATRTWRYAGCKVTGLALSASLDQSPRLTFSFMGKSEGTGTASTASWPTFDPMRIGDMSITFSGTTMPAKAVDLNIQWPVDEPYKIGASTFAYEPIDLDLSVEGNATIYLTDTEMTEYGYFDGSTDVDIAIAISDGTHSMTINLNKSRITAMPANVSERERLEAQITFKSYFDTTATDAVQVVLVNDDAALP